MILCFALFLAGVVLCLLTGHQLVWALLLGLALFFLLGLRRGFLPRSLAAMAWAKGRESLIVVPVLLLIGTDRNNICLIQKNVGSHKAGICEQACVYIICMLSRFVLKLCHPVKLAKLRVAIKQPRKLTVLCNV